MRVAKNTDVRSGAIEKGSSLFGQFSRFKHDMPDRDAKTIQRDDRLGRKATFFVPIHIAGHGRHGGNPLKVFDDRSIADVAGMNDLIHATKVSLDRTAHAYRQ